MQVYQTHPVKEAQKLQNLELSDFQRIIQIIRLLREETRENGEGRGEDVYKRQILIQGSSMGITEAVQKLNRYEGETEKDIRKLMEELKKFEERNIEELKAYL